jgi:copper chaperone
MTMNLVIEGMSCGHCVRAVQEALESVPGVQKANVSLEDGAAQVEGDGFETASLVAAVEEEGYRAREA